MPVPPGATAATQAAADAENYSLLSSSTSSSSSATTTSTTTWSPAARELVGGVLAGAVNVTSGYPFDTMKVRLQAHSSRGSLSMAECFWSIWRTEGVRGFYRGLSSPLIGGAAETGVNYLIYSRILDMFRQQNNQQIHLQQQSHSKKQEQQQVEGLSLLQPHLAPALQQQQHQYHHHHSSSSQGQQQRQHGVLACLPPPPLHAVPVAGAVAGVALSVILSPTELVKCRMQVGQHTSPITCLQHVVQTEGIWGLTRGFRATLCREIPGNALFFTVYEGLRRSWLGGRPQGVGAGGGGGGGGDGNSSSSSSGSTSSGSSSSWLAEAWAIASDAGGAILCGGLAGVAMWGTVLPLDVAKTRIQTAQPGSSWDTGVLKQLHMLWREGGRRALWAGLSPTLVRAFPANACQWLAWEVAMRQLLPPAAPSYEEGSSSGGGSSAGGTTRLGQQQLPAAAIL